MAVSLLRCNLYKGLVIRNYIASHDYDNKATVAPHA